MYLDGPGYINSYGECRSGAKRAEQLAKLKEEKERKQFEELKNKI